MHAARIDDVEDFFIGREGEAIGEEKIAGQKIDRAEIGTDAIDAVEVEIPWLRQIGDVPWIGEIDRAVGLDDDVVRLVERPALIVVGDHRKAAVFFLARDAAREAFAGDEPALGIARMAVGAVRLLAIDARPLAGRVFDQPVVADRAEEEEPAFLPPHGAFGISAAAETGGELRDGLRRRNDLVEIGIETVDPLRRLRFARARATGDRDACRAGKLQHLSARDKHQPLLPDGSLEPLGQYPAFAPFRQRDAQKSECPALRGRGIR